MEAGHRQSFWPECGHSDCGLRAPWHPSARRELTPGRRWLEDGMHHTRGTEQSMKYRQMGRTGLQVSEIGFGAWGIGQSEWMGADDEVSLRTLKAARDAGINFFDTALAYGMGHSEQLLARAFGKSTDVIIASKVPPKNLTWPAPPGSRLSDAFPRDYVLSCLDRTLNNLGRESVDVYQFHVWNDEWATNQEWLSTVREIRGSGKARFIGISINDHQPANS